MRRLDNNQRLGIAMAVSSALFALFAWGFLTFLVELVEAVGR